MRMWWYFYYCWVKPTNKSEIIVAFCRKKGKIYKNLHLSKVDPKDFIQYKEETWDCML